MILIKLRRDELLSTCPFNSSWNSLQPKISLFPNHRWQAHPTAEWLVPPNQLSAEIYHICRHPWSEKRATFGKSHIRLMSNAILTCVLLEIEFTHWCVSIWAAKTLQCFGSPDANTSAGKLNFELKKKVRVVLLIVKTFWCRKMKQQSINDFVFERANQHSNASAFSLFFVLVSVQSNQIKLLHLPTFQSLSDIFRSTDNTGVTWGEKK